MIRAHIAQRGQFTNGKFIRQVAVNIFHSHFQRIHRVSLRLLRQRINKLLPVLADLFILPTLVHLILGPKKDLCQLLIADRLEHIFHTVQTYGSLSIVKLVMAGQNNAFGIRTVLIHVGDQLQPAFTRHFNIADKDIHIGFFDDAHRLFIAAGCQNLVKVQQIPVDAIQHSLDSELFIVHNQYIHVRSSSSLRDAMNGTTM